MPVSSATSFVGLIICVSIREPESHFPWYLDGDWLAVGFRLSLHSSKGDPHIYGP